MMLHIFNKPMVRVWKDRTVVTFLVCQGHVKDLKEKGFGSEPVKQQVYHETFNMMVNQEDVKEPPVPCQYEMALSIAE